MLISTVTKTGVGASTIVGALSLVETTPASNSAEQSRITVQKQITEVKSIDDIELLESKMGCTFSYIQSFGQNQAYRARKYHSVMSKLEPEKKWDERIVWAANHWRERCKPGEFIPFAWNNNYTQKFFIKDHE